MIHDIVTIRYLCLRESERENFRDQLSGISASPAKQGPGRSRATACASYSVATLTGIYRSPPNSWSSPSSSSSSSSLSSYVVFVPVRFCDSASRAVLLFSFRTKGRRRRRANGPHSAFPSLTFCLYIYLKSLIYILFIGSSLNLH